MRGVVGIVIPTRTVWRPTLECFKKVNELQRKEEDFLNNRMISSKFCQLSSYVAIDNSKSIDVYEL